MRIRKLSIAAAAVFVLFGCATTPRRGDQALGGTAASFVQEGTASWYGPGFQGRRTASGVRFNKNDLTCAHRTLPFGSQIKVTNLINGNEVVVTVNDRGPFVGGRVVDLSYRAARDLDFISTGTTLVRLERLD